MPYHIPDSRASNLRLQRKSLDLPELVLVRFALRHESTRSRTARLGKGVAKDCSFAISKINAGIEMTRQKKTGRRQGIEGRVQTPKATIDARVAAKYVSGMRAFIRRTTEEQIQ